MKNYRQLFVDKNDVENTIILIDKDGKETAIPFDDRSKDYKKYLKWLDEGNVPIAYKEKAKEKKEKKDKKDLNTKLKALKKKVKDKTRTDDDLEEILLYLLRHI